MDRKADLHTHTTYSDGALSPYELIRKAENVGLSVISITDHDSMGALDEAIELGKEFGVEVITGVELSTSFGDTEVHILGYFIDHHDETLLDAIKIFCEERMKRAERIVHKLNEMDIPIKIESVLANATGDAIGRPHIANALVNGGHAESYRQAFNKYIGNGRPAYERKTGFSPAETVRLIADAGGLSFLAHPGNTISDSLLFQLIKSGLDGIEVTHPSHTPQLTDYYRSIVNEYYLLESGGSDFHGGLRDDEHVFGQVSIPVPMVDIMRRRLFRY
jgi:3',5'-nucleoside bisphosphate phosphatase